MYVGVLSKYICIFGFCPENYMHVWVLYTQKNITQEIVCMFGFCQNELYAYSVFVTQRKYMHVCEISVAVILRDSLAHNSNEYV